MGSIHYSACIRYTGKNNKTTLSEHFPSTLFHRPFLIMRILGIETSCDETAAAVVEDGRQILSSVVASQVDVHHLYGGVVPELASRKHIEAIVPVVEQAIEASGLTPTDIDAVAATQGPGLVGALLVGFSFALSHGLKRSLKKIVDITYKVC